MPYRFRTKPLGGIANMNNIKHQSWDTIINEILEKTPGVTEIESNGSTSLFIKQHGIRKEIKDVWSSPEDFALKTKDLIARIQREDEEGEELPSKFLAEGKLSLTTDETARVHIVLPPACDYPNVTIAKKSSSLATLEAIKEKGSFDSKMHDFIKAAIDCNLTIVLSGGTGAGKTTMLEAMSKLFKDDERIGVVEDSQELALQQPNVTYLHSTLWTPGTDPNSVATLSWCVQQINRMRTDKLIIGETRGKEFADFIVGANSGMEGSMTTIHANNARAALQKMSQFVIIGMPQPVRTANESIASCINLIVQLGFNKNRENRVLEIVEVSEIIGNTDSALIATQPIFKYDDRNDSWTESPYLSDKTNKKFKDNGYDIKSYKKSDMIGSPMSTSIKSNKFSLRK